MIYLDNNSTTPLAGEVAEAMRPFLTEAFGNPSSAHAAGAAARSAVDRARSQVCEFLACRGDEVVFTSGGTEANNAAIFGAVAAGEHDPARPRRRVVVSAVEHPSVLGVCERLARRGVEIVRVGVFRDGSLNTAAPAAAITPDTAVVSIMAANNETGVLFPVAEIGELVRSRGALFHVDAVQAVGRVPLAFAGLPIDLLTVSAHKLHGPKGVGALVVRKGAAWEPLIVGGPQERNRRAGTENVAGIVGLGEACRLAGEFLRDGGPDRVARLRDRLEAGIVAAVPGAEPTAGGSPRVCNTTTIRFPGRRGDSILMALDARGVCVSTGSACSSGSLEPSPVLLAMGFTQVEARGAVRLSLSRYTTADEVERAIAAVAAAVRGVPLEPASGPRLDMLPLP